MKSYISAPRRAWSPEFCVTFWGLMILTTVAAFGLYVQGEQVESDDSRGTRLAAEEKWSYEQKNKFLRDSLREPMPSWARNLKRAVIGDDQ
jgi:hypothetical protein